MWIQAPSVLRTALNLHSWPPPVVQWNAIFHQRVRGISIVICPGRFFCGCLSKEFILFYQERTKKQSNPIFLLTPSVGQWDAVLQFFRRSNKSWFIPYSQCNPPALPASVEVSLWTLTQYECREHLLLWELLKGTQQTLSSMIYV